MKKYYDPYMNNMDIMKKKEFKFNEEMSNIVLEMFQANNINNFYDAHEFIQHITNKYKQEFDLYNFFNPIVNYPKEMHLLYIKQFLCSLGFQKLYDYNRNR